MTMKDILSFEILWISPTYNFPLNYLFKHLDHFVLFVKRNAGLVSGRPIPLFYRSPNAGAKGYRSHLEISIFVISCNLVFFCICTAGLAVRGIMRINRLLSYGLSTTASAQSHTASCPGG